MLDHTKPLWELKNVTKKFPGIKALDKISLKIFDGEIHGLLGENGSGKSTLIKCLSGVYQPDEGIIYKEGHQVTLYNPMVARQNGVATIFQEFSLIPSLTVAENIFLGRLPVGNGKQGFVNWPQMKEKSKEVLDNLHISIDPEKYIKDLSVAQQQMVEIAKALSMNATMLIMDEPTTALGMAEIKQLHLLVRRLAEQGCAIIYISHRLDEVVDLVDRATVLKDGKIVGECNKDELKIQSIVKIMVGDDITEHYPKKRNAKNEILFSFNNLTTDEGVNGVTFDIRRGEVLGLAGLIGSGRSEIARAIFGVDKLLDGNITVAHKEKVKTQNRITPQNAIRDGIAFVTENRKYDGLFMNFFAQQNITIAKMEKILRNKMLSLKTEDKVGEEYVEKLQISPLALQKSVQYLSGGNQQKVIISRWIFSQAELFIMDEPTQGIDIHAKIEVYKLMNELTQQGKSILFISSDFPELIAMSDRIAIIRNGKVDGIYDATKVDRSDLMQKVLTYILQ